MRTRTPYDWTPDREDHLRWLWVIIPQLPKAEIAKCLGTSLDTVKYRAETLDLPIRKKGRKFFYSRTTSVEVPHGYGEIGKPIAECTEGSRLARNAVLGSDALLKRLRRFHAMPKDADNKGF